MPLPRFDIDECWRPRSATIIVTSYNYARYVGLAIDSALAQTHPAQAR